MFKKFARRGRSERRGEAYSVPNVEPLSDVRTKPADFFNIVLAYRRKQQLQLHRKTDVPADLKAA